MPHAWQFLVLSLISSFGTVICQDFIGCGGFVKSDVEIDFTTIRVKLLTKQGSLKDQTECAPNNGYYMIPVYEKGEYVLKVDPPSGWGLTPESVQLNIDGSSDPCSKNEDINFRFTGFGLVGKVVSMGSESGPKNVRVVLRQDGVIRQTTVTTEGGRYIFSNVLPGNYIVEGSHPTWQFKRASADVTVDKLSNDAGSSLVVHGYDVTGSIESDGEPVKGVSFVLFSEADTKPEVRGCITDTVTSYNSELDKKPLCHVMSDERGMFVFQSVPIGKYFLVPVYKGELTSFDVLPAKEVLHVEHQSYKFQKPFSVTGFTVRGVVRTSVGGKGVPNAKVSIARASWAVNKVALTNEQGLFVVDGMKSGTYTLAVTTDLMYFEPAQHKVTSSSPSFPDLIAARFDLCGQIVITADSSATRQASSRRSLRIYLESRPTEVTIVDAKSDGSFCTAAAVGGPYILEPLVSDVERKAGLKLSPAKRVVTVVDRPVDGIKFSQFLAVLKGSVSCLENCLGAKVSLRSLDRADVSKTTELSLEGSSASFAFQDITPGRYKVSLLLDTWCWDQQVVEVNVEQIEETVTFAHSGYKALIDASHAISMTYTATSDEVDSNGTGVVKLVRGINHACLPRAGTYTLTPQSPSCHSFEQEHYIYNTADASKLITLKAVKHRVEGQVVADYAADDVVVSAFVRGSSAAATTVGPLALTGSGEAYQASFSFWARDGESVEVSSGARELLFSPPSVTVTVMSENCPAAVVNLTGRRGVFVQGAVTPPVGGVQVRVRTSGGLLAGSTLTDASGVYSVGPLSRDESYTAEAEKDGYILSSFSAGDDASSLRQHFSAYKLAEVAVEIVDSSDQPLSGVLLSLTGGHYRQNNLTHDTGKFSFLGLAPGQYYLRPVLKEYQFQPPSQMVDVIEGHLVSVRLRGVRVAFSCQGVLTSVHGDAEASVTLEAVGLGLGCTEYQEEARTEADGTFRIRALKPSCRYQIQLKNGTSSNDHIQRIVPEGHIIEIADADVNVGRLLAFRPVTNTDICVFVRTKEEYLASIKLKLYRVDGREESLLHTASLTQSPLSFLNPVPKNGQRYAVRMESTLSQALFDYVLPETTFIADLSSKHLTFEFAPKTRPPQQDLSTGGSFVLLAVVVAVFVLLYNYRQVVPLLYRLLELTQKQAPQQRQQSSAGQKARQVSPSPSAQTVASDSGTDLDSGTDAELTRKDKKVKLRRT